MIKNVPFHWRDEGAHHVLLACTDRRSDRLEDGLLLFASYFILLVNIRGRGFAARGLCEWLCRDVSPYQRFSLD